jgi:hypothetical protein
MLQTLSMLATKREERDCNAFASQEEEEEEV